MIWLLSIISGILYRLGGVGNPYSPKLRDAGCSLITCIVLWILGFKLWLPLICVFGLSWLFLSTYWDWLFGKDNFYTYGIGIGFALTPYYFFSMDSDLIIIRAIILGLFMGLANKYINKYLTKYQDIIEEFLRGFIIIITLLLLK